MFTLFYKTNTRKICKHCHTKYTCLRLLTFFLMVEAHYDKIVHKPGHGNPTATSDQQHKNTL